jgi:TolA-binding protein
LTLNNTSTGYSTLLSEKLHLSREITRLNSEIERLKSQNNSHQSIVAEKHEIERRLNSLEVQLENEKHAHGRTRAKSAQQAVEIDKLSSRIDVLQSELTKELRAKQQHERDNRQQNVEWESQRSVLEGKIETLKKQLRSAKDKLQETQQELQQKRSNSRSNEGNGIESISRAVPLQRPGPSADYHSGVTIATPGAVRVKAKVNKQSALPGDKSAFSITPFLNRTGGPKDSPSSSEAEEDLMDVTLDESNASFRKARAIDELSGIDASSHDEPGPLQVPARKSRAGNPKAMVRDAKPAASELANVSKNSGKKVANIPEDVIDTFVEQGQTKPKKRKLGVQRDRNLFEEEEEEEDMMESRKPGRKVGLGAGRNSVLATTAIPGTAAGDRGPRTLGFGGGFSPLKRDRKRL